MNLQQNIKWLFLLHVPHFASKAYKEEINTEKVLSLGCNSQRIHFVLKRLCVMKHEIFK